MRYISPITYIRLLTCICIRFLYNIFEDAYHGRLHHYNRLYNMAEQLKTDTTGMPLLENHCNR